MPTTDHGRVGRVLALGVAVVAVVVLAGVLVYRGTGPFPDPEGCRARVAGTSVDLTTEQAENAATIAAIAVRRGLPARAVSIALATAYQESKIRNLDHGDRDSVGIFQQRPSQGWGSATQIQHVGYAANKFFDALEKVPGYQEMRITEAAQRVQRSGFPEAYDAHAADARALASALTGYSEAAFTCVVHAQPPDPDSAKSAGRGLTPKATRVRRSLHRAFGDVSVGFARAEVPSGHLRGSPHYDGHALDVLLRPADEQHRRRGWAIAQYLVANARRLGVAHVIFDSRVWTTGSRSEHGWRSYHPSGSGNRTVLAHRDHVHVDVT